MLAAGVRLGPFEIVRSLGQGGMGRVYLASDPRLGRNIAIKTLREEVADHPEAVSRFRNEARAASALAHPAIVHIYEIDQATPILPDGERSPSVLYIAMEYVRGETLREHIRRGALLADVLDWHGQIADALAKAHEAGILHRDLKPENIMITEEGHAKILDFGLAKLIEPADEDTPTAPLLTEEGAIYGSTPYMAPEQFRGDRATAQSDLFALGCMLYESLVGEHPFRRSTTVQTIHAIVYEQPSTPSARGVALPETVETLVMRCLDKNPGARGHSARQLASELHEIRRLIESGVRLKTASPRRLRARLAWTAGAIVLLVVILLAVQALRGRRQPRAPAPVKPSVATIAVLPFENAGGDPETEYLSDGLTESLIFQLSRSRGLRVIPRSSVFRFKNSEATPVKMGHVLGVEAVAAGEVVQKGETLTVRVELIDVASGSLLWGERYARKSGDILSIQDEIGRGIRTALRHDPLPTSTPTTDNEAFRLYLKGRYFWDKRTADGLRRATENFQQAIDRDPSFALAWVGLGDSYALMEQYAGIPSRENCPRAKAAVLRARQIDSALPQSYATLGLLYGHCDWSWDESREAFEHAIRLDPNYATAYHWFSLHLAYRRQFARGAEAARRAQQLDPLALIANNAISVVEGYAGHWPFVLEQSDRLIEMDPAFPVAHMWRGRALRALGRNQEAIEAFRRAFDLSGGRSLEVAGELGSTYALAGETAKARESLRTIESASGDPAAAYPAATIYASLGDRAGAIAALESAFEARSWFLVQLDVEPLFAPLRGDPRFEALVRRVRLK